MTIASRRPHPSHDRRMDDVKRELTRAMERELSFRAAERTDRARQLDLGTPDKYLSESAQRSP